MTFAETARDRRRKRLAREARARLCDWAVIAGTFLAAWAALIQAGVIP